MTATADSHAEAAPDRLPGLRPIPLLILYVALGLLPLALAAAQGLPARNVWRELSSGLVIMGFAIMLVQFVLSGRFHQVSGQFGIDRTMRFHQLMAWAVLAFILVHPFLYAVPRLGDGPGAAIASLNRMFGSPGLRTGVIAWWLLILLVPLAVWRDRLPVRYEVWRLSHGLGAAAIAALSAHHTLSVGTYSGGPWLAGFWVALTGLALLSVAYVYVIKPALQRKAPYRVVSNRAVAHRMWEVAIEPEAGSAIVFAPGQFAWLNLGHSPFSVTEHPFSISSAPSERPRIAFTIKESGDFTNQIGVIAEGTRAYVDGPHGNFTPTGRRANRLVFIAGGVGFAPIVGMLRQLREDTDRRPITLVYGNRVEEQILYREEIEAMCDGLDIEVHLVLSEPPEGWTGKVGELSPDVLRGCLSADSAGTLYFVCGPVPMMDSVEDTLAGLGVPARRIVSERFKYE
jgi:predicted ferric reductase